MDKDSAAAGNPPGEQNLSAREARQKRREQRKTTSPPPPQATTASTATATATATATTTEHGEEKTKAEKRKEAKAEKKVAAKLQRKVNKKLWLAAQSNNTEKAAAAIAAGADPNFITVCQCEVECDFSIHGFHFADTISLQIVNVFFKKYKKILFADEVFFLYFSSFSSSHRGTCPC
jgi:cytoskeletal protein RodZ